MWFEMIDQKTIEMIDALPYESMLRIWRFAPIGDKMFQGETGDYFAEVMKKKRLAIGNDKHVSSSKRIGWG